MNKTVVIARNPRARFDYFVDGTIQAGICLTGSEVKGLRSGGCSIKGAFVRIEDGEAFVYGFTIPFQDDPARARKLLLHKREILELSSHSKEQVERFMRNVSVVETAGAPENLRVEEMGGRYSVEFDEASVRLTSEPAKAADFADFD